MPIPTIPPLDIEPQDWPIEPLPLDISQEAAPDAGDRQQHNRETGPHRRLMRKFNRSHKTGVYKGGYRERDKSPLEAYIFDGRVLSAINRNRPPKKPVPPVKKTRPISSDMDRRSYKGWTHKHHSTSSKAHRSTAESILSKYHDGEKWRSRLHKHAFEHHRRMVNFHRHMAKKKRGIKQAGDSAMTSEEYRKRYGRSKPQKTQADVKTSMVMRRFRGVVDILRKKHGVSLHEAVDQIAMLLNSGVDPNNLSKLFEKDINRWFQKQPYLDIF